MNAPANRAQSRGVSSAGDSGNRGAAIKKRMDDLGITDREFHARTGIGRKTVSRAVRNDPTVRPGTYTAIEAELGKMEDANAGQPTTQPRGFIEDEHGGVVRIRLEGVFGAEAAIVEAPADNPDALAAALDIIMRRMQAQPEAGDDE